MRHARLPNLLLARVAGLSSAFESLLTTSLPVIWPTGWSAIEDGEAPIEDLPFEFFPLIRTGDPIYYGVGLACPTAPSGRLCSFSPYDGQYLRSCGTSGLWIAVDVLEAAKIVAPRETAAGVAFLANVLREAAPDVDEAAAEHMARAVWFYRQAEDVDIRARDGFSAFSADGDPANLSLAAVAAADLNETLRATLAQAPPSELADGVPALWDRCRGLPTRLVGLEVAHSLASALEAGGEPALAAAIRARHAL